MDLITGNYLCGQWPRELHQSQLKTDKATQTPGFWTDELGGLNIHKRSASWSSADHRGEIAKLRLQLRRTVLGIHHSKEKEHEPASLFNQVQTKQFPVSSTGISKPAVCRESSLNDGINWELESVFVGDTWGRQQERELVDGRCAPFPPHQTCDPLTQNIDTQLFSNSLPSPQVTTEPSDPLSNAPGSSEEHGRVNESSSPLPLLATSPKPNNSFVFKRVPPEGCEKIKVFEEAAPCQSKGSPVFSCPDRNKVSFIPNASGPFCPVRQPDSPPVPLHPVSRSQSVWTAGLFRQVGSREDSLAPCTANQHHYSSYRGLHC